MKKAEQPPETSAQVACPCCLATYRYSDGAIRRGKIHRNPACQGREASKLEGALVIGACIIAARRLGSAEMKPGPMLESTVVDSVRLARKVLAETQRNASL
jgi:hypothetical protein